MVAEAVEDMAEDIEAAEASAMEVGDAEGENEGLKRRDAPLSSLLASSFLSYLLCPGIIVGAVGTGTIHGVFPPEKAGDTP